MNDPIQSDCADQNFEANHPRRIEIIWRSMLMLMMAAAEVVVHPVNYLEHKMDKLDC